MNESNKIQLFNEGYTIFNLFELNDLDINKALDELYLLGNKEFKNLRYKKVFEQSNVFIKDNFENLESIKQSIKNANLYEMWYYNDLYPKDKFNKVLLDKIKSFFYNEKIDSMKHSSCISMYNDNCVLIEHNDGYNPNSLYKCVILIYLNKEDEIKIGGELLLNKNVKIKPIFGTCVIMDFTKNDVIHGVSPVLGYNRKCFLNFC